MWVAGLNVRVASVDSGDVSRTWMWGRWPRKVGGEDTLRTVRPERALAGDPDSVPHHVHGLADHAATEGVMWCVMRRAMSDSKAHLDELARHDTHNTREL